MAQLVDLTIRPRSAAGRTGHDRPSVIRYWITSSAVAQQRFSAGEAERLGGFESTCKVATSEHSTLRSGYWSVVLIGRLHRRL